MFNKSVKLIPVSLLKKFAFPHALMFLMLLALPVLAFADAGLGIVPMPQKVKHLQGGFQVSGLTQIVLPTNAPEDAQFAASDLQRALKEILGVQLQILESGKESSTSNVIVIGRPDVPAVSSLMKKYDLKLTEKMGHEGYVLGVGAKGVVIGATDGPGLLYGTMSLRQMLRVPDQQKKLPAVAIHDWPHMKMRGIQDEFSYGQVSTMENFKDMIRFLAEYKMNTDFFYFEDTFKFKKYPTVGVGRGAMTPEQAKELQAFAKPYNVEIIPIFEMLGNQGAILMLDEVRPFAEYPGAHSFSIQDDSFEFLENCFHELADTFESPYFHAGLDESWDLGFFRSEKEVNEEGRGEVHAKHYRRLNELLKSRGKTMIMYADIILVRPEILDLIPKDIILMDWHYEAAQHYKSVPILAKHGFPIMVLPGMNNWDRIFPTLSWAMINIRNFTLDGIKHNALGSFTSTWGDNGSKNLRELNYYGYAYGAEVSWSPQTNHIGDFSKRFCTQFYGPDTSAELEAVFALLENWPEGWWFPLLDYFRHPFLPRKDERAHTEGEMYRVGENARMAAELIEKLRPRIQRRKGDLDYFQYCAESHQHYVQSQLLVRDIQQFDKKNKSAEEIAAAQEDFLKRIADVRSKAVELKGVFKELWLRTNIEANLHYCIEEYDRLIKTWDDASHRVSQGIFAHHPNAAAEWIYHPDGFSKDPAKPGKEVQHAYYRRTVDVGNKLPESAGIQLHGDTHLKIYVNGKQVGEQFARRNLSAPVNPLLVRIYDIKSFLNPGKNVIAVEAHNYGTTRPNLEPGGPVRCGGFNFYGEIVNAGGKKEIIASDSTWKVYDGKSVDWGKTGNWTALNYNDSNWVQAQGDEKATIWVTYPDFKNNFRGFSNRR